MVMAVDGLRRLAKDFGIVVYTYHTEALKYFCEGDFPIIKDMPDYTWHLEYNTLATFRFFDGFSGFLLKEHKELFEAHKKLFELHPQLERLVKTDSKRFFLIDGFAEEMGWDRRYFPLACLDYGKVHFDSYSKAAHSESYITIHDGFDIHNSSIVSGRATKTWKWEHWNTLVRGLKLHRPDIDIIQLGSSTSRLIDGVDISLVNKTSIKEAFDVLSKSRLHIDGDSGLVHAATRLGVPCVVLWGPTPARFYGYEQNINIVSDVCPRACYGVKENWNDKCPIGYMSPECMDQISPEEVLKKTLQVF